MHTVIICVLLAVTAHAFTLPNPVQAKQAVQLDKPVQPDHTINKRFIMSALLMDRLMDDDDYDDIPLRRRRPSRRTVQLAQMIRQLAGAQGLTPVQLQNMQQNLQNLQLMQNMQQLMQTQTMQGLQSTGQQGS